MLTPVSYTHLDVYKRQEQYHPHFIVDTTGKLFEEILKLGLLTAIDNADDFSDRQYPFRNGRLTKVAINTALGDANVVKHRSHYSRLFCFLASLKMRNAFNLARWRNILHL